MAIPARISIVTLGVRDFETMRRFYGGLGWRETVAVEDFSAFDTGGAVLALFPFTHLAEDAHVAIDGPQTSYRGIALALNVETREMVDTAIDELRTAGARITKEPVDAVWGGRSAYFADPEDNLWEVAWNPAASFDARGGLIMGGGATA